eukprot:jgi/Mesvir1/14881/Mv26261-RA.1
MNGWQRAGSVTHLLYIHCFYSEHCTPAGHGWSGPTHPCRYLSARHQVLPLSPSMCRS